MAAGKCPGASAQVADGGVAIGATKTKPGTKIGQGRAVRKPRPGVAPRASSLLPGGAPEIPGVWIGRDGFTVNDPVTISDLVNFKPQPGTDHMEPNGWAVIGLDTNFYATAQSQLLSGMLLGQEAQVRFTPVRYHWTYGDGGARATGAAGRTWKALGIHEFDPTSTSHVYQERGEYDVDLTIDFAAEFQYAGGDWYPVQGVLPLSANRLHITAGEAKTVLVEQNCLTRPSGPGC
ncbi:PKD domain-containing protein [Parafrigoribacterium soli]|uniref:PKD domain-containing protein n=1 Tax=Parafrigoribacterium soli TaxID=3144663 RepID=UPI0032EE74A0